MVILPWQPSAYFTTAGIRISESKGGFPSQLLFSTASTSELFKKSLYIYDVSFVDVLDNESSKRRGVSEESYNVEFEIP